jgi:hypothetical protein
LLKNNLLLNFVRDDIGLICGTQLVSFFLPCKAVKKNRDVIVRPPIARALAPVVTTIIKSTMDMPVAGINAAKS